MQDDRVSDAGAPPPPGHVLIRIDDLANLLAARQPAAAGSATDASALSTTVALLTSHLAGAGLVEADLIGDVPAEKVVRRLVVMNVGLMTMFADHGSGLLRQLGAAAVQP